MIGLNFTLNEGRDSFLKCKEVEVVDRVLDCKFNPVYSRPSTREYNYIVYVMCDGKDLKYCTEKELRTEIEKGIFSLKKGSRVYSLHYD